MRSSFLPFAWLEDDGSDTSLAPVLGVVLASLLAAVLVPAADYPALAFAPDERRWLSFLSSPLLLGGAVHWAAAMLQLAVVGPRVAAALRGWFIPFYLACGAAALFAHVVVSVAGSGFVAGPGGAVAGVSGAFMVLFPGARLRVSVLTLARRTGSWGGSGTGGMASATVNASLFVLAYLAFEFLAAGLGRGDVVAPSPAGGLLLGAALALAVKRAPAESSALVLSGESGEEPPAAPAGAALAVEEAIRGGRESDALDGFAAALRRDPRFQLSPEAQLWAADRLSRAGRPHMALSALERFARERPDDPNLAHALRLAGYVRQAAFGDLEGASASYRLALAQPSASEELKRDVSERLRLADALLRRTFTEAPREDEKYAVLMEGSAPPSPAQARLVAEGAGAPEEQAAERLAKAPGFVLRWLGAREAGALADRLEAAGLPVVVVAEPRLLKLPAPTAAAAPEAVDGGLLLRTAAGEDVRVAWEDCLLIAAGGVGMPRSKERQMGLFEVGDVVVTGRGGLFGGPLLVGAGSPREFDTETVHIPVLELVCAGAAARYRWTPCPELDVDAGRVAAYFDALQGLITAAPSVPVERGALAAFERRIPERSIFPDAAAWDAYLTWQVQLAALKRPVGPRT